MVTPTTFSEPSPSTAMTAALACAVLESLRIVRSEPQRRERLNANIRRFRKAAAAARLPTLDSPTPIQPILLRDNQRAVQAAATLREKGFWVAAVRPPTVPAGTARLRITLSAAHQPEEIEDLVQALSALT